MEFAHFPRDGIDIDKMMLFYNVINEHKQLNWKDFIQPAFWASQPSIVMRYVKDFLGALGNIFKCLRMRGKIANEPRWTFKKLVFSLFTEHIMIAMDVLLYVRDPNRRNSKLPIFRWRFEINDRKEHTSSFVNNIDECVLGSRITTFPHLSDLSRTLSVLWQINLMKLIVL